MKHEEIFDQAVAAVRDETIDPATAAAARQRVERRLRAELDAPAAAGEEHRIHGCEGFRALIPAYLAGALSEPRRILFEDHTRECVPCRRALAEARRGSSRPAAPRPRRLRPGMRWALAAGLAGVALAAAALVAGRTGLIGPDVTARVRAIDGELVVVDGGKVRTISAGERVARGMTVRTGGGSNALLELPDGSTAELGERAELTLARRFDGAVLDLGRGALIVEAAQQHRGHLYVRTDDCTVSVIGTIFSVRHGVRGSRVSVLDGEVRVRRGAELAVLRPGDQYASTARLAPASLESELSWSRNAEEYEQRIAELKALGRELDRTLATPSDRTSTRLLDLAPAGTVVWAGLPNLSGQLSEAWDLIQQRVAASPVLSTWWQERFAATGSEQQIADGIRRLHDLGAALGDEIGVAVGFDAAGGTTQPLLLAEVRDAAGFDGVLDAEIARINAEAGDREPIRRVDDPATASGDGKTLLVWRPSPDLVVASPDADRLRAVAAEIASGSNPFVGSRLRQRLAETYAGGTGWLVGFDAAAMFAHGSPSESDTRAFQALGLDDADQLVLESETHDGETVSHATLAFQSGRRGVASWLAAPAPSGALEFVSSNASFATAGLVKQPTAMFDDLMSIARSDPGAGDALQQLADTEAKLGFSLRDDLAASLGADFAFAIDGPWLPKPSWKLVVEVVDPSRLTYALGRAVAAADSELVSQGKPGVRFGQEEVDGRVYLSIGRDGEEPAAYMSFVDGYLVAAPSRALIGDAVALRAAGASLATAPEFLDRLPRDADPDFSGMVWQNLGSSLGDLTQLLGDAAGAQQEIKALAADAGPSLVVAYGEPRELRLVVQGMKGPLGMSLEHLLGVAGALGIHGTAPDEPPATDGATTSTAEHGSETPVVAST